MIENPGPSETRFGKVAIVSAGIGSGHSRAADALTQAFSSMSAAKDVRHLDALQFARAPYRKYLARTNRYIVNHRPRLSAGSALARVTNS